jgi:hypothetical protein
MTYGQVDQEEADTKAEVLLARMKLRPDIFDSRCQNAEMSIGLRSECTEIPRNH